MTSKLSGKTNAELVKLAQQIRTLPENQMPIGSFWLYTAKARKMLRQIDWAIFANIKQARLAAGNLVTSGYSGRQTKRKR